MKSKKIIQTGIVTILLVSCYISAQGQTISESNKDSMTRRSATIIKRAFYQPHNNQGRQVNIEDAKKCIDLFEPTMARHGILKPNRLMPHTVEAPRRNITTAEVFGGKELYQWMTKTIEILDPEGLGENVGFQLVFGVYTKEFLEKYLPGNVNAEEKANRKDRFTTFIIPFDKNSGAYLYKVADSLYRGKSSSIKADSNEEDTITAFELGGLKP